MAIKISIWERSFPGWVCNSVIWHRLEPSFGLPGKILNHNVYSFLRWNFRKMAKYALLNMDSNLMDWVMHYIGTWILKLAPSWGSQVIFHSEKMSRAWLHAKQGTRGPAVLLRFSRSLFSSTIISHLFSFPNLLILFLSSQLTISSLMSLRK